MIDEYDLVGVGLGPFNLGLAALAEPLDDVRALFVDGREAFSWHPGLLLEGARLQVPFLADLVSLVDPTSRWSFLAYLRRHDRLFPFYFAERFQIPRREYDDYCRWVAESLPSCRFGTLVQAVRWDAGRFLVELCDVATGALRVVAARNVVLGVGTEPVVPPSVEPLLGTRVFHAGRYLEHAPALAGARDVTVIGSGQSGAEVFLDLLRRADDTGWHVRWLTRSPAFAPMEYSKLGLEHFTPDYTRYFRQLSQPVRDRLLPTQWQLYKAISAETIAEIHDVLYERSIGGRTVPATLMANVAVEGAGVDAGGYVLTCRQTQQDRTFEVRTDRVVLATGYAARRPALLDPLADLLDLDERGRYRVDSDYRVALDPAVTGSLFVQNAEAHTHGVGAPDLGLGAWRSATILNALTGGKAYRLPERTAYTSFGIEA
ncbi:L-lysine 6-monooxygenase [Micromonospora sp. ATCC 39149]|uniref:L-lysine N6-monooxygenase MbtG n=1 Tax=Micromonospora carbonacea TaxID=47853 RepID=A0A7D5Y7K1_9ACTN|nr:SidA/IucD/PvdA family monooxygenase [Micromonospora sp. ATCC 39149]EEP70101.1 L-lysine 6-monooxygenase [Micromonospora sp. ATCC 39149]QLJ96540.1 SidA/IucD/PvdA family monooxygenase [Micromonospora carbonacea]